MVSPKLKRHLRARSQWVRIVLILIKGFSRCARITVTLRFRAWRIWIEVRLCVCNVDLPRRRPPSSSAKHESVANCARLPSLGRVARHRGRSSRIVSQKLRHLVAPPQTLSLSSGALESECLRKFILAENESPELQHRHAADREVSDPTELASTSAVRSSSIFLAATLRCFGRMIVLHTRQHAWKEGFQVENLTGRLEKAHPWKRIAAIQNRLDRIGRTRAILTRSILTRLMRKFMRIAMETVIVWVRIARF